VIREASAHSLGINQDSSPQIQGDKKKQDSVIGTIEEINKYSTAKFTADALGIQPMFKQQQP
jgi:hypothetical protein